MSQLLIQQYLNQLAVLKKVSGTTREGVVREAFPHALDGPIAQNNLIENLQHLLKSIRSWSGFHAN